MISQDCFIGLLALSLSTKRPDFINDLDLVVTTQATEVARCGLIFVDYDIQCIQEVEKLKEMETAREGEEDAASGAMYKLTP